MDKKPHDEDVGWRLPRLIADADLDVETLEALRDGLFELVSGGLHWQKEWPHFVSDNQHLNGALAATCVRGMERCANKDWLRASVLALRIRRLDAGDDRPFKALERLHAELPAMGNKKLFWAEEAFVQSHRPIHDVRERFVQAIVHGSIELRHSRDWSWIKAEIARTDRSPEDREMLLYAAMRTPPSSEQWRDHLRSLTSLVADRPDLLSAIEDRLRPSKDDERVQRWEIEHAVRMKEFEEKEAEAQASWLKFWREVAERPDAVFSADRAGDTSWNLWRAMRNAGGEGRGEGWNRRFIEEHFDKATADRLRLTLMGRWRKDWPTLISERPEDQKNTYLVRWQLGLAAIYAEAEDPDWAAKLSEDEATLATRYAQIELNGLPIWMGLEAISKNTSGSWRSFPATASNPIASSSF